MSERRVPPTLAPRTLRTSSTKDPTINPSDTIAVDSIYENRRSVYGQCFHCMRPKVDCFCAEIPQIDNRLPILILQHRHERRHPFNTVRITERALANCQVLIGFKTDFVSAALPILPGAGLLYPGEGSQLLPSPSTASAGAPQTLTQLVILDGTWHHTKTFVRDIVALRDLPRYRLNPLSPSRYRIRAEPTRQSLSTLEATVAALEILEPQTVGTPQLLRAFDRMVESQLANPKNPHAAEQRQAALR